MRAKRGGDKYSFHPVEVSEAHAFAAIGGELHLRAPDGSPIDLRYERHAEHASGDWSWIGRDANGVDAVLTFGERAMFGVLAAANGEELRLTTNGGQIWMVQQDSLVESRIEKGIREGLIGPDYRVPQAVGAEAFAPGVLEEGGALAKAASGAAPMAPGDPNVDVLLGYTPGFVTMMGGTSQAQTRLNHIVTVGNQALANSSVAANLRLVGTLQVNYTDNGSNESVLEQLTGSNGSSPVTVPASLQPLREERERVGADLVSLVRRFRDTEHQGCGIAWLIGGGQSQIVPGHEAYGYTVISDSNGTLSPDGGHYCRDETLVHEIGHNLGAAHDRDAAMGDDGVLDAEDYGRYAYSFGYKTNAANGNFYTVMAYGDAGQTAYRVFSNPQITSCGGRACGVANQSDNARTLRNTVPLIAAFRAGTSQASRRDDFNGDGISDVLWRNSSNGRNTLWLGANSATQQAVASVFDNAWRIVGTGDFNSDGRADIVWRHRGNGRNLIWYGGNSSNLLELVAVPGDVWQIAGVGDFDGDGVDDLLWRHGSTGGNRIWRSGNSATRKPIIDVSTAAWQVGGVGDFDGDGQSDILWRHAGTGENVIWRSGDYSSQIRVARVADVGWQVGTVGDFNGDGISDVFWRHATSGQNVVWLGGDVSTQQAVSRVPDLQWVLADSGDFDGDGKADVVWRHTGTGANVYWRSANASTGVAMAAVADRNWQVVP
ncbi:hypothetical protein GCM10011394_23180 [Luteimonas terricola]|uniref:VCBS repeat-containing protein n=1 Tax=Luteimonas terricola TaxID=645597 RepID=A0ABQ2EJ26_9GAMM|nr:hypothetical protein GCM10011394_23180 [Luteimonas terricola]